MSRAILFALFALVLLGCDAGGGDSATDGGAVSSGSTSSTSTGNGGTGTTSSTSSTGESCSFAACPVGVVTNCTPDDISTVQCCQGNEVVTACAQPFGVLTTNCGAYDPSCASGLCAVVLPDGLAACCESNPTIPNPCNPDHCVKTDGGVFCYPGDGG